MVSQRDLLHLAHTVLVGKEKLLKEGEVVKGEGNVSKLAVASILKQARVKWDGSHVYRRLLKRPCRT